MRPERDVSPAPRKTASRPPYKHILTHETEASAFIAIQSHDAFSYVYVHNNGPRGRANVYRCVEHRECNCFFRLVWSESDVPGKLQYSIEKRGGHTSAPSTRKRTGIHPALLAEVDAAVVTGGGPMKVRRALIRTYELVFRSIGTAPILRVLDDCNSVVRRAQSSQAIRPRSRMTALGSETSTLRWKCVSARGARRCHWSKSGRVPAHAAGSA
jgi:hypothetical protein